MRTLIEYVSYFICFVGILLLYTLSSCTALKDPKFDEDVLETLEQLAKDEALIAYYCDHYNILM